MSLVGDTSEYLYFEGSWQVIIIHWHWWKGPDQVSWQMRLGLGATGGIHETVNLQQSLRGDPAAVAPLEVCAPVRLHSRRKDDLEPVIQPTLPYTDFKVRETWA